MINQHGDRDRSSVIYNYIANCKGVISLMDMLSKNHNFRERETLRGKFCCKYSKEKHFSY